jgi:hypothetical protein
MSKLARARADGRVSYSPGGWTYAALVLLTFANLLLDRDLFQGLLAGPPQAEARVGSPFSPPPRAEGQAAPPLIRQPVAQGRVAPLFVGPAPREDAGWIFLARKGVVGGLGAVLVWVAVRLYHAHWQSLVCPRGAAFLLLLHVSNGLTMLGNVVCAYHTLPGFVLAVIGITHLRAAVCVWRARG